MKRSKNLSWQLKLSDWLTGGLLTKYRKEAEFGKSRLKQVQIDVDNLKKQLKYAQKEKEQLSAQLLMAKGFHVELGEAQLKVRQITHELFQCQEQLNQKQQETKQVSSQPASGDNWYEKLQTTVEVLEIKRLPQEDFDCLWGFRLTSPQAKVKIQNGSMIVQGWVLGKKALATAIRIKYRGETLVETPANLPSPSMTKYYPDIAAAGRSRFETSLSVVDMPKSAELQIQVILENEEIVNLSTIALQR